MQTNIEFLDVEPIENVITCLNYQMDRVVFFGYPEVIKEYKKRTKHFLEKYCHVPEVEFYRVSDRSLNEVRKEIEKRIKEESDKAGNHVYIDITGGESLPLVGLGIAAENMKKPIHLFHVDENKHSSFRFKDEIPTIGDSGLKRKVSLDINSYIEMFGGKIDDEWKGAIDTNDLAFMEKIDELWKIQMDYKDDWNKFTGILRDQLSVEKSLQASKVVHRQKDKMQDDDEFLERFHDFLERVKHIGGFTHYSRIISDIKRNKHGQITEIPVNIEYADFAWKECLTKSGTLLELHVYQMYKAKGYQVLQSVHIDWDGEIHVPRTAADVNNEIDVIALDGYTPTFISCKAGKLDDGKALPALYELETVASRFGGKYVKKVLATLHPVTGAYAERAKEMGIELLCCGNE